MPTIEEVQKDVNKLRDELRLWVDRFEGAYSDLTALRSRVETMEARVAPVGTIVSSLLPWERFLQLIQGGRNHWIPADGRDLPDCLYRQESGRTKAPDLRGMFVRGVNKFADDVGARTDASKDPQTRNAGDEQHQAIAAHGHALKTKQPDGFQKGANGSWASNIFTEGNYNRVTTDAVIPLEGQGSDTRPNNVAVYWYLRIN